MKAIAAGFDVMISSYRFEILKPRRRPFSLFVDYEGPTKIDVVGVVHIGEQNA